MSSNLGEDLSPQGWLHSRAGVSTLCPIGQSQPVACFCRTQKLRVIVTFLNHWNKKQESYFVQGENYVEFKFQCPQMKSYWNTAALTCLHVVCGCHHATIAELSSRDRDYTWHFHHFTQVFSTLLNSISNATCAVMPWHFCFLFQITNANFLNYHVKIRREKWTSNVMILNHSMDYFGEWMIWSN